MLPTNPVILQIASPHVMWPLCVAGLCVWLLLRPRAYEPVKILVLGGVLSVAGVLSDLVLNAANTGSPLKFDYYLYGIDKALGISAFMVARLFTEWERDLLYLIYQILPLAMLFWYGVNLKSQSGRPRSVLIA